MVTLLVQKPRTKMRLSQNLEPDFLNKMTIFLPLGSECIAIQIKPKAAFSSSGPEEKNSAFDLI